jgi:hypothetical protein
MDTRDIGSVSDARCSAKRQRTRKKLFQLTLKQLFLHPLFRLTNGALTGRLLLGRVNLVLRRLPFERPALFLRT